MITEQVSGTKKSSELDDVKGMNMPKKKPGRPPNNLVAMSASERMVAFRKRLSPEERKARQRNHEDAMAYAKNYRKTYPDCYVASLLGVLAGDCQPELIETKREQMLLKRALQELNKTLKEIKNGN